MQLHWAGCSSAELCGLFPSSTRSMLTRASCCNWGCGSSDLFDIESNICHGVQILKQAMIDAPNTRVALLRYNGCVRGRNTPNCHRYDDTVLKHAGRAAAEMRLVKTQKSE